MKKCWFLATAVVALVLVLAGCGGVTADIEDEGSADTYSPQPSEDTYTPPPPAEEDTTQLPPPPSLTDNDGDGVVSTKDCNDNNVLIHPYAVETCANGKDDNCDSVIDEGCVTPPVPPATTDTDKDGYPDGPQDCSPNNANVHPGAIEVCNSIDDDCDGVIDEQCGTTPTPTPTPSTTTTTFSVSYPDNASRTLNVQVYDDKSDLGGWWDKSASSTSTSVTLSLDAVPDGICGFRLNVSEGSPATSWLCAGNGSTASLDPDATVTVVYKGISYTKGSFMTWSAPGGTASGCSALLKISTAANCSP